MFFYARKGITGIYAEIVFINHILLRVNVNYGGNGGYRGNGGRKSVYYGGKPKICKLRR